MTNISGRSACEVLRSQQPRGQARFSRGKQIILAPL
nr:MAG TPA: hypothetical protein [Caudoviricetes sp.]